MYIILIYIYIMYIISRVNGQGMTHGVETSVMQVIMIYIYTQYNEDHYHTVSTV